VFILGHRFALKKKKLLTSAQRLIKLPKRYGIKAHMSMKQTIAENAFTGVQI
jgi:hypothetical protein